MKLFRRRKKEKPGRIYVCHSGYSVEQEPTGYREGSAAKFRRTYRQGDNVVMTEYGSFMDANELMIQCDQLDELLRVLGEQAR